MTRGPSPGLEAPSGGGPEPADGETRGADVYAGRAAPVPADWVAAEPVDCYTVWPSAFEKMLHDQQRLELR